MRSFFLLVTLCGIFFTACQPEKPATFSVEVAPKTFNETVSPTGSKVMTTKITNTSKVAGTINWSFTETQVVNGWTYNIVTNNVSQSGTTGSFELAAGASIDVTVAAKPNGVAGTGKAKLAFKNDGKDLQSVTYQVTAAATGPKFSMSINNKVDTAASSVTSVEYKTKVKNLTSSPLNLTWTRTNGSNNPRAWKITICDNETCHLPNTNTNDITVPANGEFDLKVDFNASGSTGTGSATVKLFETGDAGTTQTFMAKHTAT